MKWSNLYFHVINGHYYREYSLDEFELGAKNIRTAYRRIDSRSVHTDVDYTLAANRYAYVYMFGSFHSELVEHLVGICIASDYDYFLQFLRRRVQTKGYLSICSMGGGPGSDVIGVREAIRQKFRVATVLSAVIDKYFDWITLFDGLNHVTGEIYDQSYMVGANLLTELGRRRSVPSIRRSDIICMVKFISAVMFQDQVECLKMIKFVFQEMTPGAIVIFIDNAGGGFLKKMIQVADSVARVRLQFQLKHVPFNSFENPALLSYLYRATPLTSCKVSFAVWEKI